MEQVGLHDAAPVDGGAVAELDQVGLGQPVGLAPHAAARSRAPRERSQTLSAGVPVRRRARTTARRPSRRRCRPARCARRTSSTAGARRRAIRPTSSHFAAVVTAAATAPATQHAPARRAAPAPSTPDAVDAAPRAPSSTPTPSADRAPSTGTSRQQLDRAAGHPQPQRRVEGAAVVGRPAASRRSCTGGLPEPRRARPCALRRGAAESTATSACLGTLRPGAVIPELPRKARLPTLAALDPQPAAAELVAADQRVVGEERPSPTVVIRGISSTVDASTSAADRRRRAPAATPA